MATETAKAVPQAKHATAEMVAEVEKAVERNSQTSGRFPEPMWHVQKAVGHHRGLVAAELRAPRGAKLYFDALSLAVTAPFEEASRRTSSALIGAEGSFLAVVGAGCWRVELELPHGDRLDIGTWVVGDTPSSGTTLRPLMVR